MHAFGHTDRIPLLRERLSPDTQTKLFLYRECGDFLLAELSPKAPI
jgi:hypothetical protein